MTRETIRGIDHVGIAVPDIEAATTLLTEALGARVIYVALGRDDPPLQGEDIERGTGSARGTRITGLSQIRIGTGPTIELLEIHAEDQARPARASDLGLNHISPYTDDPEAAVARFEAASGTILSPPIAALFPAERGDGNTFCYGLTPWGMPIEFVTYPGEMGYEKETELRRWHRGA